MKIIDLFKTKKQPLLSFEIFPPKPETPIESIYNSLEQFAALKPDFMSVTYGAGGSQKGRTLEIASKLKHDYGVETMAHFTCVGHNESDIDRMLEQVEAKGLENILALRGDPPVGEPDFDFSKNLYKHASELIMHIRRNSPICIAAAAYPEGHIDSKRISSDLYHLKQKADCGVDFLVTQLFFDNRMFFDFMERVRAMGIKCPVTPGIMPVFKAEQIKRIAVLCGASFPAKLMTMIDKYGASPEDMQKAGIEYAAAQIRELIENGVDGIHLLTMNRPKSAAEIIKLSGLS